LSLYQSLKKASMSVLEAHPLGYVLGGALLDRWNFLLPHEVDYHGIPVLAKCAFPPDGLVLDLGANRGHSARAFLYMLPQARVHSVEANALHQPSLEMIRRKFGERFSYSINAVSDISGEKLDLFTPCYGAIRLHSATSIFEEEARLAFEQAFPKLKTKLTMETTRVVTLTVDELELDISFAKLDVQGAELPALQGMRRTIERCRPCLLVEKSSAYVQQVAPFVADLGYRPWRFNLRTLKFIEGVGTFDSHHSNVFLLPEEKTAVIPTMGA